MWEYGYVGAPQATAASLERPASSKRYIFKINYIVNLVKKHAYVAHAAVACGAP